MDVPEPRDPRDERGDHDQSAEERAWQSIVDNYGERAEIDESTAEPPAPAASEVPFGGRFGDPRTFLEEPEGAEDPDPDEVEGYVPPPPPPLPTVAPDRGLAWAGVIGAPAVLLIALLLGLDLPSWLGYLMIAGFVGGFVYLVLKMPREPRDPWDDGAQV